MARKTNAFCTPWHCFNWLFFHFFGFLVALLLYKMNQNNIIQSERINNAKTRINWIEFTDNDDCKANRKMRELEREKNTATAFEKYLFKGPHLNDTFVIFCHVTHAGTKKYPVPFFFEEFFKSFFLFWIFSSFSLSEIMPNFAYDRLINFVWSQYLFNIVEMRTTQLLFEYAQVHFNSNGGKMWTRYMQWKSGSIVESSIARNLLNITKVKSHQPEVPVFSSSIAARIFINS